MFSGGTARAFRSLAARLGVSDGCKLTASAIGIVTKQVAEASPKRLITLGVSPARAETLGAGAVVLASLVNALGASSILVSLGGLREGVVLREVWRLALESRGATLARATPPAANLH
jgi:exopolyphosphatase/pppGpp-phosphohydrolase